MRPADTIRLLSVRRYVNRGDMVGLRCICAGTTSADRPMDSMLETLEMRLSSWLVLFWSSCADGLLTVTSASDVPERALISRSAAPELKLLPERRIIMWSPTSSLSRFSAGVVCQLRVLVIS